MFFLLNKVDFVVPTASFLFDFRWLFCYSRQLPIIMNTYKLKDSIHQLFSSFSEFISGFFSWGHKRLRHIFDFTEHIKDFFVDGLIWKRGRLGKPAIHFGMLIIAGVAMAVAPIVSDNYPVSIAQDPRVRESKSPSEISAVLAVGPNDPITVESEKPRGEVLTYKVEKGDTISSIAKKFTISEDTLVWANTIDDRHNLSIGQELKIPPLSGVMHTVRSGDTVYTIAKKYSGNPQSIVDYYGNMIDETLSLHTGDLVMVPDGEMPEAPRIVPKPITVLVKGDGTLAWPMRGGISQYTASYHPGAIDITDPVGTPIRSADGGTVISVESLTWGYGKNVLVDHGNGIVTRYAHMSGFEVSRGDKVSKGQVVGYVGMTGRTTGPHLHFEVIRNGVLTNPMAYLQ